MNLNEIWLVEKRNTAAELKLIRQEGRDGRLQHMNGMTVASAASAARRTEMEDAAAVISR